MLISERNRGRGINGILMINYVIKATTNPTRDRVHFFNYSMQICNLEYFNKIKIKKKKKKKKMKGKKFPKYGR